MVFCCFSVDFSDFFEYFSDKHSEKVLRNDVLSHRSILNKINDALPVKKIEQAFFGVPKVIGHCQICICIISGQVHFHTGQVCFKPVAR